MKHLEQRKTTVHISNFVDNDWMVKIILRIVSALSVLLGSLSLSFSHHQFKLSYVIACADKKYEKIPLIPSPFIFYLSGNEQGTEYVIDTNNKQYSKAKTHYEHSYRQKGSVTWLDFEVIAEDITRFDMYREFTDGRVFEDILTIDMNAATGILNRNKEVTELYVCWKLK